MSNNGCRCGVPRWKEQPQVAFAGWWYRRWMCLKCYGRKDARDWKVDQSNAQDCEAADRSQGIV